MSEYPQDPWSTHISLLATSVAVARPGPVLELGGGTYSTRMLSAMCLAQGRKLLTADGDYSWVLELSKHKLSDDHDVLHANNWDECIEAWSRRQWAVILIDHWPPERRGGDLWKMASSAEFLICHDIEDNRHGWNDVFDKFEYKTFDRRQAPHTACVSMVRALW